MRIALDVRYRTRSGASSYIRNIVPFLLDTPDHEFVLIRYPDQRIPGAEDVPSIQFEGRNRAVEVLWDQVVLPRRLVQRGIDLYHAMKLLGPLSTPCPKLTVAHSITTPFRGEFPASSPLHGMYWNLLGNRLYRSSTHVIAVSEYVKSFVVEELGMPEEVVSVVLHGIDPRFFEDSAEGPLPAEVVGPFLLLVGNLFPVKNQVTAVRAFGGIAAEFPDLRLVLAGRNDTSYAAEVRAEAQRLEVAERVVFTGFVEIPQLVSLYRRSELLLMPSLTEGCPVTLLEAMACGTAVAAAARGGIPEVGGDAVSLLPSPVDADAWAGRVRDLLRDVERRAGLRSRAAARATAFTWPAAADETLATYYRLGPA